MVVNIKATQRDTYTADGFWGDVHLLPEPLHLPRGSPAAFLEVGGPAAPLTTSWIIGSFLSGPPQQQRKLQSSEQRELEKQTRRENNCRPHVFPLPVTLPNQTSRAGICSAEDEPRLSSCISGPSQRPAKQRPVTCIILSTSATRHILNLSPISTQPVIAIHHASRRTTLVAIASISSRPLKSLVVKHGISTIHHCCTLKAKATKWRL